MAYPHNKVNELWLLKDVLHNLGGGMGCHLYIAQTKDKDFSCFLVLLCFETIVETLIVKGCDPILFKALSKMAMNMNTRRANARMEQEENVNEEVPPQAPQNPQSPNDEGVMSNVEIRADFQTLT
ncbi:hypothetical protein MTR67_038909 [Solanum verrucosum]|uniref:Uncharacterized protein n=1 Tax=Solanum verrucosum TaxID=315347 RepID=A0AAF0UHP5_SOLVR|nr:hypothetical protein MTR67_038909 [Solanum verrucosum]